jgi:hypothetical protein
MLTEEQQQTLINLCKAAEQQLGNMKELLALGEQRLNANAELLRQSTEDIKVLLAFIESRGLRPPKIQSKFIN